MKSEVETLEAIRDGLRRMEARGNLVLDDLNAMVAMQEAPRRINAAFKARAILKRAFADLELAHAEGTDILFANWPDQAGDIVVKGPGGR